MTCLAHITFSCLLSQFAEMDSLEEKITVLVPECQKHTKLGVSGQLVARQEMTPTVPQPVAWSCRAVDGSHSQKPTKAKEIF